jgi:hypothetical protein
VNPGERRGTFDLRLYYERGQAHRGVLLVGLTLSLNFMSRRAVYALERSTDEDDGPTYAARRALRNVAQVGEGHHLEICDWSAEQRRTFRREFRRLIQGGWSDKFRIKTDHALPDIDDIGVRVMLSLDGGPGAHFQLHLVNITGDVPFTSGVRRAGGDGNMASFDDGDIAPSEDTQQVVCVHEFGHMIGLPDEYAQWDEDAPASADAPEAVLVGGRHYGRYYYPGVPHWASDVHSIMHLGMRVRPRHYAHLARWVTDRARRELMDAPDADSIEYHVLGPDGRRWTTSNAGIYAADGEHPRCDRIPYDWNHPFGG